MTFLLIRLEGLTKLADVQLLHLENRAHHPLRLGAVAVQKHRGQRARNDLPRHAEFVGEPSAPIGLSAGAQPLPEFVDFVLRITVDDQRNRPIETEMGPTRDME